MEGNDQQEHADSVAVVVFSEDEEKKKMWIASWEEANVEVLKARCLAFDDGEREEMMNMVNDEGQTMLHIAASKGHEAVIRWIMSDAEGGGRALGFKSVLLKDVEYHRTALRFACRKSHLSCCQAIVEGCKVENGEREEMLNALNKFGYTILHLAATYGHESLIRWIMSDAEGGGRALGFKSVFVKDLEQQDTVLYVACQYGHLSCCQAIVEGCKVENGEREEMLNALNKSGWTILHVAAWNGHEAVAQWIMSDAEGGGRALGFKSVLLKDLEYHRTALHVACREGHLSCCQAIVEGCKVENGEREEMLNALNKFGWTILHFAAWNGNESLVRWIMSDSKGGGRALGFKSVLVKDLDYHRTALHVACREGHLSCCQAIVEGCKVENGELQELLNSVANDGKTMLHLAAWNGHESVVRWIMSDAQGGGRALGFKSVLVKDREHQETALHDAVEKGHLSCCQAIVEGCKVENGEREQMLNSVNNRGWTILHAAAWDGHESVARWIMSDAEGGGRALGFKNILHNHTPHKSTALHIACQQGHLSCCQAIVEGCKVENGEREEMLNALNKSGNTILHRAASSGHELVVRWIMSDAEGGGRALGFKSVLVKDLEYYRTVLHVAASKGHPLCCQAIVEGCKVENGEREEMLNSVNIIGITILHAAAWNGRESVVRWIMSDAEGGGRALGFKGIFGNSNKELLAALHVACREGHLACCQVIVEGCKVENGERDQVLNGISHYGSTILHVAISYRQPLIIQWLLSNEEGGGRSLGFKSETITASNTDSKSALHLAASEGSAECIQALLSGCTTGERIRLFLAVDKQHGWTPLHEAARCRQGAMIRELLRQEESKMIVDARDHRGMTALHRAVCGGVDEESRREWGSSNRGDSGVIEALLSTAAILRDISSGDGDSTEEAKRSAILDVNIGWKSE